MANDSQSWEDIGNNAVRQVKSALSHIDLEGIANAIGKSVGDAARQLGLIPDHDSPYIIREEGAERNASLLVGRGVLLLFVALGLISVGVVGALVNMAVGGVLGIAGIASGVQGARRIGQGNREKRFNKVIADIDRKVGNSQRIALVQLARMVEVPVAELDSCLRTAINRGLIPEGRIDASSEGETLYLTAGAWEAEQRERGAAQAEQAKAQHAAQAADARRQDLPKDATEVLDACSSFASGVVAARAQIADADVRASLDGIASKVQGLASYVEKHPETAGELRKLATYYLPATQKLAASYAELEARGSSDQVRSTRDELKQTLSMVDSALSKLSDDLLREQSWDLKSDMDVMRQMLKQDGLS